jgi:hypothetical protein
MVIYHEKADYYLSLGFNLVAAGQSAWLEQVNAGNLYCQAGASLFFLYRGLNLNPHWLGI